MSFEQDCTGSIFSLKWTKHRSPVSEINDDVSEPSHDDSVRELSRALDEIKISDISEDILYYIAGLVVRKIIKNIDCYVCSEALIIDHVDKDHGYSYAPFHRFLDRENNGGLIIVSHGVLKVIRCAEQAFRYRVKGASGLKISSQSNLIQKMITDVLMTNGDKIEHYFPSMLDHRFENEPVFEDDHLTQPMKKICSKYLLIRLQTYGKRYTCQIVLNNAPSICNDMNGHSVSQDLKSEPLNYIKCRVT